MQRSCVRASSVYGQLDPWLVNSHLIIGQLDPWPFSLEFPPFSVCVNIICFEVRLLLFQSHGISWDEYCASALRRFKKSAANIHICTVRLCQS